MMSAQKLIYKLFISAEAQRLHILTTGYINRRKICCDKEWSQLYYIAEPRYSKLAYDICCKHILLVAHIISVIKI